MWLLFLIFMQAPPERVELKVSDMGLYPVPSTPPIIMEQDLIKWPELESDIPTLPFQIGKVPELKRVEIPFNEILYKSIAQKTVSEYQERIKKAVKSKASDKDISLLKMEMEKTLLMQRLEISKMEGKDEEVRKINKALRNLEHLMQTVEVER